MERLLHDLGVATSLAQGHSLSGGSAAGGDLRAWRLPSFVLLDEPFAGIDPIAVMDIRGSRDPEARQIAS